jgi:hypothetical protein
VADGPSEVTNHPTITFSSPDTPTATFECKVDAAATFSTCNSPYSPTLTTGTHTVQVRAISSGYPDPSPASVTFEVDVTAPVVTITSQPPSVTDDTTPTVAFTVDDPDATVTCQVDDTDPVSCSSPFTADPLPDGTHSITVRARDLPGNEGSKTVTFKVDTVPPQVFSVACGDVAALRAAITAANGTLAPDTIDVTGGPCTFTLTDSVDPAAGGNGLPIVVRPLTIEGHGSTIERSTASGTPNFRIIAASVTSLTLHDLTLQRGAVAANSGGGVLGFAADLTLDHVTLFANAATGTGARGGGLATLGGTLHVTRSSLLFNAATVAGGISTIVTPGSVARTVFFGNVGTGSTGAMIVQGETVDIENSTFSTNSAANAIGGLAVLNNGATAGRANVASSTFADNGKTGDNAPGGALFTLQNGGTASIHVTDTIVTDTNSTAAPTLNPCDTSFGGTIVNDGGNLEWPGTTCGFGTNADPKLTAIEAAGDTFVHRPLPGSPAIDLGGDTCPSVDQRGATRPDGPACDSGAYETPSPETTVQGPTQPTAAASFTFTSPDTPDATFECRVDGGDWSTCTSPHSVTVNDGQHTFEVRAIAPGGYPDPSPASTQFTVDATPPETTITGGPSGTIYNQTSSTFTFTSNRQDATFECRLDSASFEPCTSPKTVSGYSEGTHTFAVRAKSPTGVYDPTPATRTFTYKHCNILRTTIGIGGVPIVICL